MGLDKCIMVGSFECCFDQSILDENMSFHFNNNSAYVVLEVNAIHYITEEDISLPVDLSLFDIYQVLFNNNLWLDIYMNMTVKRFLDLISYNGGVDFINDWYADEVADSDLL
jgi:hypothetical protein